MTDQPSRIVALLPMKAHSERVPGKNYREFLGKPLFRWTLDVLLSIDFIDLVVINTDARQQLANLDTVDSERILIRDREPSLCGDFVSMNRIIEDDIEAVAADTYLMTHTTNPLLSGSTIVRALEEFHRTEGTSETDSLFTVNRHQTRFYRKDGAAINHDLNNLVRTQDLEPWYEENSCLYIFTKESFRATGARIGNRPRLFETERIESIDIDDEEAWDLAVTVARDVHRRSGSS